MWQRRLLLALIGVFLAQRAVANPPPQAKAPTAKSGASLLSNSSAAALAGTLRGYLLRSLPSPLYEGAFGWGHTTRVSTGVKWSGKGLDAHPNLVHRERNDGTWRKIRVTAQDPANNLVLDLRNVQNAEPGRTTFQLFLALDARFDYTQQEWKAGVKLYDGSIRGRLRLQLTLDCEVATRWESGHLFLPEAVVQLHVKQARVGYEHLTFDHIAGLGGETAKVLGDAIHGGLREWRPSLERQLLTRAETAVLKAADDKEVRIGLSGLVRSKGPAAKGAK